MRIERMRRMEKDDVDLGRALIPLWRAERCWAEKFGLEAASDILTMRGRHFIPGSACTHRTHGIGVDIDRGDGVGGIDHDFDKPDPAPWRLGIFAVRQMKAGNIPRKEYRHLVEDEDRLKTAAKAAIATEVR